MSTEAADTSACLISPVTEHVVFTSRLKCNQGQVAGKEAITQQLGAASLHSLRKNVEFEPLKRREKRYI